MVVVVVGVVEVAGAAPVDGVVPVPPVVLKQKANKRSLQLNIQLMDQR